MKKNIVLFAVVVGCLLSLYFFVYKPVMERRALEQARVEQAVAEKAEKAEQEKRAEEEAVQEAKRVAERARAEAEAQAKVEELNRKLKLATIRKGEGVEHTFIRQLIDDPNIVDAVKVKIGKREYDLDRNADERSIEKWAGQTAHLLAIFFGYVDLKTGRQIRVKKAGEVALLIDVDRGEEKLSVDIYKKEAEAVSTSDVSYTQIASTGWLDVGEQAAFQADVEGGVASFEYIWPPARKAKKQKK